MTSVSYPFLSLPFFNCCNLDHYTLLSRSPFLSTRSLLLLFVSIYLTLRFRFLILGLFSLCVLTLSFSLWLRSIFGHNSTSLTISSLSLSIFRLTLSLFRCFFAYSLSFFYRFRQPLNHLVLSSSQGTHEFVLDRPEDWVIERLCAISHYALPILSSLELDLLYSSIV